MIVCLCRGLSDTDLRDTIAAGATTLEAIGETCGAGTDCRSCCDTLRQLVAEHRACRYRCAQQPETVPVGVPA